MRKKIGVMIDRLDHSKTNIEIVKVLNNLTNTHNVALYVNEQGSLASQCLMPVFYMKEAWLYNGVMVATDLLTAESLIKIPGHAKKYFYNFGLEWTFLTTPNFNRILSVYTEINLLAGHETHCSILSKVWKVPVGLCQNFNIIQLLEKKK